MRWHAPWGQNFDEDRLSGGLCVPIREGELDGADKRGERKERP